MAWRQSSLDAGIGETSSRLSTGRIAEGRIAAYKDLPQSDLRANQDGGGRSTNGTAPDQGVESNGSIHQPFFRLATNQTQPRASNQETPPGVAIFLFDLISPNYEVKRILDPCAGKGSPTKPWRGRRVIAFEIERGKDFFSCPERIDCDLVLMRSALQPGTGFASGLQA